MEGDIKRKKLHQGYILHDKDLSSFSSTLLLSINVVKKSFPSLLSFITNKDTWVVDVGKIGKGASGDPSLF